MKRLVLLFLIILNGLSVFAQKADTSAKVAKSKMVDGVSMTSSKDLIDNISSSPELSVLTNAIKAAGLTDTFKSGNFTLLAPTNKAFAKLAPGQLDTLLLPAHKAELISLVNGHVIAAKITANDMQRQIKAGNGQASFKTLTGSTLTATINANRNIVLTDEAGNQSVISRFDIPASNGVIDVITDVLRPKN
jgi:uncharacterized surface protein with fasciclin (FAS1) repeats